MGLPSAVNSTQDCCVEKFTNVCSGTKDFGLSLSNTKQRFLSALFKVRNMSKKLGDASSMSGDITCFLFNLMHRLGNLKSERAENVGNLECNVWHYYHTCNCKNTGHYIEHFYQVKQDLGPKVCKRGWASEKCSQSNLSQPSEKWFREIGLRKKFSKICWTGRIKRL